ncbi:lasso RiPP family leader peptide-containing protein [Lentzea sp. NPDC034063]|uniref:lasso RiPP family leader peptide-containing protein n=1 Tax=unclassified Lentzea TaxID=2643253 RepID=UPI003408C1AD
MAMTSDDDGFPEVDDPCISHYEPPAVFDAGKVVVVTRGSSSGSGDPAGQSFT